MDDGNTTGRRINVLVVDDSPVARQLLVGILESDPQLCVVGVASDGAEAYAFVCERQPDVVLMDIHMPRMDGFEATRRIMETHPLPTIICSATSDPRELSTTFQLLEAGAVACVEKPVGPEHPGFEERVAKLVQTVKLMSEVKVVRRWRRATPAQQLAPVADLSAVVAPAVPVRFIGIGASTGGPPVLNTILAALPADFSPPILVVQHIAPGFLPGLADWLADTTRRPVHVATHRALPQGGHVYLAADGFHMGLGDDGLIHLTRGEPESGLRPAVAHLFRSLADVCGPQAVGVLLTGMGRDGALELKLMRNRGAVTIAQNRDSSVVHGMPGVAIELDAVTHVLPADQIAGALIALVRQRNHAGKA